MATEGVRVDDAYLKDGGIHTTKDGIVIDLTKVDRAVAKLRAIAQALEKSYGHTIARGA